MKYLKLMTCFLLLCLSLSVQAQQIGFRALSFPGLGSNVGAGYFYDVIVENASIVIEEEL